MFDVDRSYPAAMTSGDLRSKDAEALAVQWVLKQHAQHGGQVLLHYPSGRRQPGHVALEGLSRHRAAVTATSRSFLGCGWSGGAVLAAWPTAKTIGDLADDPRTRALCVLTWNVGEVAPWATAVGADVLGGTRETLPVLELDDPVVAAAMETITSLANLDNSLRAGFEKAVAVGALLALHKNRHALEPERLYAWALAHAWPESAASDVRDHAKQINAGRSPRISDPVLRPDAYDTWVREAATIRPGA